MKHIDLKHDEETAGEALPAEAKSDGKPSYPYGTSVTLNESHLKKLGISEEPEIGHKVKIEAHGHVKSYSANKHEMDGKDRRSVEIQLTHMGIADHDEDDKSAGEKVYGGGKEY